MCKLLCTPVVRKMEKVSGKKKIKQGEIKPKLTNIIAGIFSKVYVSIAKRNNERGSKHRRPIPKQANIMRIKLFPKKKTNKKNFN